MGYAVGLMSGTSLDGIDAALVEISGEDEETIVHLLAFETYPIQEETIRRIKKVLSIEESNVALICSLNVELGYLFATAVKDICKKKGIQLEQLEFVASHGQTIYHLPIPKSNQFSSTLQIGESAIICEETKTTVVSNFRERDMALGGQGAPIVPYSEYILYKDKKRTRLLQNIGGIGNVTVIPKNAKLNQLVAFDTGPGNMIIDELCRHFYQVQYDKGGAYAATGKVNQALFTQLMTHPFIAKSYPKTTGREEFGADFTQRLIKEWPIKPNDLIATATQFTASSIAENLKQFIDKNTDLIVAGGGSYNETLIKMIKVQLPTVNVQIQEEIGHSSEAKEAIAMTILGNQTLHHKPSNVPSATGASSRTILGKITYYS
ncbi:anhydro-N-acetylmuramic acid kinase AnmK [Carnobacterium sp. TMP28]|uniref:anhydro-N-acetylmuramic acid kinase AnmK n=1 Tax=Carnobacterium sp. TMP28 TaxID=3397060 RepID=UPI0039E02807